MKTKLMTVIGLLIATVLCLTNCRVATQEPTPTDEIPVLLTISPSAAVTRSLSFRLTAVGNNFKPTSQIVFNGTFKATTYVSPTELYCTISPDETIHTAATQGTDKSRADEQVPVQIYTATISENDGLTSEFSFTIRDTHRFNSPVKLAPENYLLRSSKIAADGDGNVYVLWQRTHNSGNDIWLSRSADNGATFAAAVQMSDSGDFQHPDIACAPDGTVYAVWFDNNNNARDIYFRKTSDHGQTWSAAKNISLTLQGSFDPIIAVDGNGYVYVVFVDDTPGRRVIMYTHSTNGGSTWSSSRMISNVPGDSEVPALAVSNSGGIYVTWRESNYNNAELYFIYSANRGNSWSIGKRLITLSNPYTQPDIALAGNGKIYLAFDEVPSYTSKIYLSNSSDNGFTWQTLQDISNLQQGALNHWAPKILIDAIDNVNLIWNGETPTQESIFFCRSIDGTFSWNTPLAHTGFTSAAGTDAFIDADGTLHITGGIYSLTYGGYELYYSRSN